MFWRLPSHLPALADVAWEIDFGDLVWFFFGLGVVRLIDTEELEADGEWSKDICRRGGVKDMTRERGGDSVDCAGLWYEEGDSDI